MKDKIVTTLILIFIISMGIAITAHVSQLPKSQLYNTPVDTIIVNGIDDIYHVKIESAFSLNPNREITKEDIDDAILELMEDAKYNSEHNH